MACDNNGSKNSSWCPIPWMSIAIRNNGNLRVCCQANTSANRGILKDESGRLLSAATDDIKKARNSPLLREIRVAMLKGEQHPTCLRCNREDANGIRSRRNFESYIWRNEVNVATSLSWTKQDGSLNEGAPLKLIDFRFGNKCNLKCRMCGPTDSDYWYEEFHETVKDYFSDTVGKIHLHQENGKIEVKGPNPYQWYESDFFASQIKSDLLESVEKIHCVGGEPLLIRRHLELLKRLVDMGRAPFVHLDYNSNLTILPDQILDLWGKFKRVSVGVSIDGFGPLNDYIRYPSKFSTIKKNLEKLDCSQAQPFYWIATTVLAYNIFYLPELIQWRFESGLKRVNSGDHAPIISAHCLHTPEFLNIRILPRKFKDKICDKFHDFSQNKFPAILESYTGPHSKSHLHAKLKSLLEGFQNYMLAEDWSQYWEEFKTRTQAMDSYRNQSLKNYCPELNQLIDT